MTKLQEYMLFFVFIDTLMAMVVRMIERYL